jgi:hypothetical protein
MGAARALCYGLAALVCTTLNIESDWAWQGPVLIALMWAVETLTKVREEEEWAATVDYLHQQMDRLRKGQPEETKEEG